MVQPEWDTSDNRYQKQYQARSLTLLLTVPVCFNIFVMKLAVPADFSNVISSINNSW